MQGYGLYRQSEVPLLLDPKLILDYIDDWHKDPNTPLPDFKLTPGQSQMLTHFIPCGSRVIGIPRSEAKTFKF